LKDFTFGWKDVDLGWDFLQIFQIGRSLENFTLVDTESGLGYWEDRETGKRRWAQDSQVIFEALCDLGSGAPRDEGDIPPGPFISMGGVKRLGIMWTKAAGSSLIPFLRTLTGLEDVWLEDVDRGVLEDVTSVQVEKSGVMGYRPLRLDLRWTWEKGFQVSRSRLSCSSRTRVSRSPPKQGKTSELGRVGHDRIVGWGKGWMAMVTDSDRLFEVRPGSLFRTSYTTSTLRAYL
jgi:hypothetical protein